MNKIGQLTFGINLIFSNSGATNFVIIFKRKNFSLTNYYKDVNADINIKIPYYNFLIFTTKLK